MQVYNNKTYYNSIYLAIVVNTDTSLDPIGSNRIQIYIPGIQYEYDGIYEDYMNESNKKDSAYFGSFPWAVTLVSDLQNGQYVYGSFINNTNGQYIILGIDANNPNNQGMGGDNIDGLDLINLVMPVTIMEETGLGKDTCPILPTWPDDVPNSSFETIEINETSARGLGILQWTASRAFDLLYDIAKASNGSWENCWSNKQDSLYIDIKGAITAGSSSALKPGSDSSYRNDNAMLHKMKSSTSTYKSVEKMLKLNVSRTVQEQKAPEDTQRAIDILQSDPYNLTNPAMIIFLTDAMNQYGNSMDTFIGYSIKGCTKYAAELNKNGQDMMSQFNALWTWWQGKTKLYMDRRGRVVSYINYLYEQGKLTTATMVDLGDMQSSKYIPEVGDYVWPTPNSDYITCYYGQRYKDGYEVKLSYDFKYKGNYDYGGYPGGTYHYGVDFAPKQAGVDGDPVIAGGDGTVAYVCSVAESGGAGQGNCIGIRMDRNTQHYLLYMHLCKKPKFNVGDRVKAGQVIGYMGTTGNSTGTHLHLGLHIGSIWPPKSSGNRKDPLPYLGKSIRN